MTDFHDLVQKLRGIYEPETQKLDEVLQRMNELLAPAGLRFVLKKKEKGNPPPAPTLEGDPAAIQALKDAHYELRAGETLAL